MLGGSQPPAKSMHSTMTPARRTRGFIALVLGLVRVLVRARGSRRAARSARVGDAAGEPERATEIGARAPVLAVANLGAVAPGRRHRVAGRLRGGAGAERGAGAAALEALCTAVDPDLVAVSTRDRDAVLALGRLAGAGRRRRDTGGAARRHTAAHPEGGA